MVPCSRGCTVAPELTIVGIGDGGAASLTPEARDAIRGAGVLCGGTRHLAFFPEHGADRIVIKGGLSPALERIRQARNAGHRVVVLASGDPGFFGIGATLADSLGRAAIRIVPSVSSVALAFARLGEPWHDAVVLSAHGRPLAPILGAACAAARFAVLTDDTNTPAVVARALLACGMEDAAVAVCEHLGGARERIVRGTLTEITTGTFARLNVLVVLRDPAAVRWGRPLVGLPESAYAHERGMITKPEVRAVSISQLALHDAQVVWDIGAGSGSVAIECASLVQRGLVFAVERDPEQLAHLQTNARTFHAGNLSVIAGAAPAILAGLPAPDRVFIGGTGGVLATILDCVTARLTPGGRVVMNIATLEHLADALGWFRSVGWPVTVVQVAVTRGTPIAGLTRLAALNPVYIVSGTGPGSATSPGGQS